jgi:hypothetical protein
VISFRLAILLETSLRYGQIAKCASREISLIPDGNGSTSGTAVRAGPSFWFCFVQSRVSLTRGMWNLAGTDGRRNCQVRSAHKLTTLERSTGASFYGPEKIAAHSFMRRPRASEASFRGRAARRNFLNHKSLRSTPNWWGTGGGCLTEDHNSLTL